MVARAYTVAFQGVEARPVEVQCALSPGLPAFSIVGLPDKAVSEARDRVRAALGAMAIALPSRRITVNLSPADLPKEGSHFDLPIALALLAALDIIPKDTAESVVALGELSLDGTLIPVIGALPAAMAAAADDRTLLCPAASGAEAAWVSATKVIAAPDLGAAVRHFTGQSLIEPSTPGEVNPDDPLKDMRDVKGQERAKRALEIAAAGRHHLILVGTPGSGKSMLAARLSGILPPLTPSEALETSMIHSLAGLLDAGGISRARPFREPHHTASMAAIIGGGRTAKPGEVSLAHNGVLFMDEFPEFPRTVLETLRQPIETGEVMIARANAHVKYPCAFMLVAAANPCKCGYLTDPDRACARVPACGEDYMGRISGPLMDRFDLRVDVPPCATPTWTCQPRATPRRRLPHASKRPATSRSRGSKGAPTYAPTPTPKGKSSRKSRHPTQRAAPCSAVWPNGLPCRRGAITVYCVSRGPSQIWTDQRRSVTATSPKRSATGCRIPAELDPARQIIKRFARFGQHVVKHRPNVGQIAGNVHLNRYALRSHTADDPAAVVQQDFSVAHCDPDWWRAGEIRKQRAGSRVVGGCPCKVVLGHLGHAAGGQHHVTGGIHLQAGPREGQVGQGREREQSARQRSPHADQPRQKRQSQSTARTVAAQHDVFGAHTSRQKRVISILCTVQSRRKGMFRRQRVRRQYGAGAQGPDKNRDHCRVGARAAENIGPAMEIEQDPTPIRPGRLEPQGRAIAEVTPALGHVTRAVKEEPRVALQPVAQTVVRGGVGKARLFDPP